MRDVKWPWDCLADKIDVLHIHWPEQVFWETHPVIGLARAAAAIAALILLKLRGVKLVWCVHNLEPHDAGRQLLLIWRIYAGLVGRLVHGFVTLSPSTVELARAHFAGLKKKPATFAWHPPYLISPSFPENPTWRERHGIESSMSILAFIGAVCPYKGLEELICSFREVSKSDLRLIIAGRAGNEDLRATLERAAGRDTRIVLDLRWLSNKELTETVLIADVVVLPFRQTLHSGSIIYALSCGKAVITPATHYANDLCRNVGPKWIRIYDPPLTPDVLSTLYLRQEGNPDLTFLSIEQSGAKLKEFYETLTRRR